MLWVCYWGRNLSKILSMHLLHNGQPRPEILISGMLLVISATTWYNPSIEMWMTLTSGMWIMVNHTAYIILCNKAVGYCMISSIWMSFRSSCVICKTSLWCLDALWPTCKQLSVLHHKQIRCSADLHCADHRLQSCIIAQTLHIAYPCKRILQFCTWK